MKVLKYKWILILVALALIPIVSGAHATSTTFHGQVLNGGDNPVEDADIMLTISTSNSCTTNLIYNTTFVDATNSDGVFDISVNFNADYNVAYYVCVFVDSEQVGNPQPARIGQGEIDEGDVDFATLNADYFVGDGSGLTNIDADTLNLSDNEWLYFDTADTKGIRWNSTYAPTGILETNAKFYAPNIFIQNSVDASLGYFDYLQMGYKGFSTGYPFTVINQTGSIKNYIGFDGNFNFADTSDNQYIIWDALTGGGAGMGLWNYGTYYSLEIWSGSDTDDTIELYNPTNIWGNLVALNSNVTADYFIGDGSQLTNLPSSTSYWNKTGTTLYPATSGDEVFVDGDLYVDAYDKICLDQSKSVCFFYNSTYGFIEGGNNALSLASFITTQVRIHDNLGNSGDIYYNGTNFEFNDDVAVYGNMNITGDGYVNGTEQICTAENGLCGSGGMSYWNRTGTTIYTATIGDDVNVSGNLNLVTGKGIFLDNLSSNGLIYNLSAGGEMQWFGGEVHLVDTHLHLDDNRQLSFGDDGDFDIMYDAGGNITEWSDNNGKPAWFIKDLAVGDTSSSDDGVVYFDGNVLTKWLRYNLTSNRFEFNDNTDVAGLFTSNEAEIGDGTNYVDVATDGSLTLYGTGRVKNTFYKDGYTMYSYAGTYNGIVCTASALSILNSRFMVRSYADGSGANVCDNSVGTLTLPKDYEAGTNINVTLHWSASATTGAVFWGVGMLGVGDNENYIGTETYQTATTTTAGTTYYRTPTTVTFSGTGLQAGDDVLLVVYRHGDAVGDTLVGNSLIHSVQIDYIANKLGESI